MELSIRKIGNSKGLVIPAPLLDMLNLTDGSTVDASVAAGELRLKPLRARKARYDLPGLLAGITKGNRHGPMEWGSPLGKETPT
jgi:antitoxin MazE